MRKTILSILIIFILLAGTYLFYHKINKPKKEGIKTFVDIKDMEANIKNKYYHTLSPKDLNPKSFIELFIKKYNKTPFNFVSMMGDFPEDWVKPNDIQYLITIMRSKEKCCGFKNIYSSTISDENGEVGGFAIIFLNSYISNTKINLGSNCDPKTDEESVKRIERWYQATVNKN